ncbi:MAG: UvrD-helicase domain-containing protein, partial [Clostridia bacterium]
MTTNWTENQQQAIEKNGGTILVSAAAGSGKTAVLVERIIKKITGENNIDVDKLLVVTFSNDAAKEMKDRISSALNKLFINNPNDLNLKRQQVLISRANISTVHSFCFDLIRNNYHALNLEPDFIISDSIQSESMKKEAMNKTLDDYYLDKELSYDKIGKKDLNLLLSDMKSDKKLSDAIETIYKYIISCPSPSNELKKIITVYEKEDFCGTLWCEFLFEEIK